MRSYSDEVRKHLVESIRRKCDDLRRAAGLPDDLLPVITMTDEAGSATYNDPALTARVAQALKRELCDANAQPKKPVMGAEDFSEFGRMADKIPICMFWLGAVKPELVASGKPLPSLHSRLFAPDYERSIQTGVKAMTSAITELTAKK